MADRIEVTKAVEFVALGAPAASIVVPKVVMFVVLTPGYDGSAPSTQGHVHTQIRRSL